MLYDHLQKNNSLHGCITWACSVIYLDVKRWKTPGQDFNDLDLLAVLQADVFSDCRVNGSLVELCQPAVWPRSLT